MLKVMSDVKDAEVQRSAGHSHENKAGLFQHYHTNFLGALLMWQ